jgi:hypothetical protein
MVVPVQAGTSTITVVFVRTGDRKLGDAIAAASGLIAIFLLWSARKKNET